MMNELMYIIWNPQETFSLGFIHLRWYSMCWLIGLVSAYFVVRWLYKDQKVKDELFEPLFIYCFVGILVGARLGHCLFYEPDYYLSSFQHFMEMLLPMKKTAEGWHYTGYAGLASHGGTLGLMIALWLYCRRTKMNLWHVLDNIAIATGITACFIRLGNLMNSEIIGNPTNMPWAFIFERVDQLPRHPGQLYEAIAYALLFVIMIVMYRIDKRRNEKTNSMPTKVGTGFYFGFCLFYIFTFRFFIEYTKADQVDFESGMLFNMGQLLSVPFIILGIACMRGGKWMKRKENG
ncbi:MAG: prolipoprotein diacylglyceryl transferase [Prevotella sp.]|nr:prolipoprotein diacylglyceryl transferase [Prevotella sp.]